jgi:hypothetical protein
VRAAACDRSAMSDSELIRAEDRVALLREGIVVLHVARVRGRLCASVTGAGVNRVADAVCRRLGVDTDVEVVGLLPRRLLPLRCVGHMEREPGRLQVRFVLCGDEHVDDIVVAEDADTVAVLGSVCTSESGEDRECCEVPCHVYLERPLGRRVVVDGVTGEVVPYKNVYATLGT